MHKIIKILFILFVIFGPTGWEVADADQSAKHELTVSSPQYSNVTAPQIQRNT